VVQREQLRHVDLVVGETYEYGQYFAPDRNPVVIRVIGRERVKVPAGEFDTIVLQPVIKTKGIFSEKGEAGIWLTDDASRVMVKMQAEVAFGTLTMSLTSIGRGAPEEVIAKAGYTTGPCGPCRSSGVLLLFIWGFISSGRLVGLP